MPTKEPSRLHLYNTLTKKEETFESITKGKVLMYTCGPTVYGRPHIGNYASFLMADLLRRWLEVSGYAVTHAKNITDVGHLLHDRDQGDDKIEKQARSEKLDPLEIARKYEAQFLEDEKALNILEPFARPRATETVKEMLAMISILLEKGFAYETNDGIYFSVEKFPAYGSLSGNTPENLSAGARIEEREGKHHPADFALWKKCVGENAPHLLRWKYATGERVYTEGDDPSAGFPGWHIECSAMSRKFLADQIDIHTGGEDNIFPHHECEIAQSEASSSRKPFVRTWVHRRRIQMGEEKMSKSLGNVLSLPDVMAQSFSPLDLRYYLLSVHYRTNLKFTEKGLEDAKKARRKILEWMTEAGGKEDKVSNVGKEGEENMIEPWKEKFFAAMNADLNTPSALATVFDLMTWSRNQSEWSNGAVNALEELIGHIRHTFGCFEPEQMDVSAKVLELLTKRKEARKAKDYHLSDQLRDAIHKEGYEVRDNGDEQELKKL
ncbi:MAG: cysteinyl-tRNA synthetase [Candidatus Peribacter riflensis]|uniref:Cysteine--tRNA ligase n=1 Tax=Candidatus Peribacter riflensis TaxID=1735162 RepID=A0A0S1SQD5_9BACT|nr:MAG: cysteinyl-tRNA synthetase [Candidatus Peribacter riflensis]ALM11581.1 MAG: cysteinyl-tRNA synthetase [Candidatus Peribacter riflensis]ALM12683.1 MAG: cysteinyl-tRNA synthetase [Candidatus Peribacter riflensis]ALM13784.1 MAG: cysteinyl-tRNA synthetase [Candidatus Peribacter riflensis]ALM14887.1 MAG: cysteinyl-tRNA synthetase [Candidatus Peribacter riflensis]